MTDEPPDEVPQAAIAALLKSGFPFQTAIARIVRHARGCRLLDEEVPWPDEGGPDRFLDLVAEKVGLVLVVECKKTQEVFTFLQPGGVGDDVLTARCVFLKHLCERDGGRIETYSGEWLLTPRSPECAFCVSTNEKQRMLEPDVQVLLRGTDAYLERYRGRLVPSPTVLLPEVVAVPIIVTNAKLFAAKYEPGDVSLDTGQLLAPLPAGSFAPVPWVRFRKAFSADHQVGDRTVFVVSANGLPDFLGKLAFMSRTPSADGGVIRVRQRR
jgi:hypothetical protein